MFYVKYKHVREPVGNKLIGTICYAHNENENKVYIGVAICSEGDNFSRKEGRELSFKRACKAYFSKRNTLPIQNKFKYGVQVMLLDDTIKKYPYKSIGEYNEQTQETTTQPG